MKRIIERAATNGVMSLSITGGEPFIYVDEVLELLRFARASASSTRAPARMASSSRARTNRASICASAV